MAMQRQPGASKQAQVDLRRLQRAARRRLQSLSKITGTKQYARLRRRRPEFASFVEELRKTYERIARAPELSLTELHALIETSRALMVGFSAGVRVMSGEPPIEHEGGPTTGGEDGGDGDGDDDEDSVYDECMKLCDAQYKKCLENAEKVGAKAGKDWGDIVGTIREFEEASECDWDWYACWWKCWNLG